MKNTITNEKDISKGEFKVNESTNLFFNSQNLEKKDEFDLPKSIEMMKDHAQFLRGKSILLKGKEERFIEQQQKIIKYRRIIMSAIREFALDYSKDREQSASVINKFERILEEIDIDVTEEEDEIMG